MGIEIVPLGETLGAEIRGVDLSRRLDASVTKAIRAAWLEHLVLLFRGAPLSDQNLIDFTLGFGDLEFPPSTLLNVELGPGRQPAVPLEVNVISNVKENGKAIGHLGAGEAAWHTDSAFVDVPPAASVLHALEIPPAGGNTSFLNMYAAYETLAEDLRKRIEGKRIKHDQTYTSAGDRRDGYENVTDIRDAPGPWHPAVRTHPETGRKALYLGRRLNGYVEGYSLAENEALLDAIWAHTLQDSFVWEHEWAVGDVLMWDNRCVMHRREAFDDSSRRIMHRTQLAGDRPS